MMMKVGLEMSAGSIPRPIATPRASTVFPVPSSPDRAKTSFGRAARPRRSPSRSVCREEWLTRSSEATSFFRSATGDFALELAPLEEEPEVDAEIRPEDGGEDREPPLLRHRADRRDADAATERAEKRYEGERANEPAAPAKRKLVRLERVAALFVGALFALLGLRRTMLGVTAPFAAPSPSCHEGRLALGGPPPRQRPLAPGAAVARARSELFVALRRLLVLGLALVVSIRAVHRRGRHGTGVG